MELTQERLFDLTLTGQPCLDLANTIDWRTSEQPLELIKSYADLLRWARHALILTEPEARRLARSAARRPAEASKALKRAIALRETLYRIMTAIAGDEKPRSSDLKYFNGHLSEALARLRIKAEPEGFSWQWEGSETRLDWILWPIVRATGELLASEELQMLRQCPGQGCGWLFIDTSRNKSRRWCAMEVCGNRAKARRHYEQVKSVF